MDEIRQLITDEEWQAALPALHALRPKLQLETLLRSKPKLVQSGYTLIGVDRSPTIVAVAGYTIQPHIELGQELFIHDFATHPNYQRQGFGRQLLTWFRKRAEELECFRISLNVRLHREGAQRFYEELELRRAGFVYQVGIG